MNISQPVSSELEGVEFTSLSSSEIKSISVKRIENPQTLDHLTRPIPGGLYDTALGAWGDIPCATCNLTQTACPGHPGHIDLPLPVYHPINFDVLMRLLRSQCIHCYRFRMRRIDISRAICKLRLLQYGLLHEATVIDDLTDASDASRHLETDSEGEAKPERIVRVWESFVRRSLHNHRVTRGELRKAKHEGAAQMRRTLLQDLLKELPKGRTCGVCKGLSPTYRKDGFVKIFQKALSPKEQAKLIQGNFKLQDALAIARKAERAGDEAIADMSSESEDDEDEGEGESLDADGDVVMESGKAKIPRNPEDRQKYLVPSEVKQRMVFLFEREKELLELIFNSRPIDRRLGSSITAESFFIDTILVPPNRFRPEAKTASSKITEAQQNVLFTAILSACSRLALIHAEINSTEAAARPRDISELQEVWAQVQEAVNSLIDRDKNPTQGRAGIRNEDGIKQKLEKKEGLFRKNMMGKRVNYAARSVISPDPNIETNEIGVPPVFAQKLTYPEPVTSHNFRELQQAVINGADKWPGALAIENENGQIINLGRKKPEERLSLANQLLTPSNTDPTGTNNKKVYRHLTNGDVVLMNRQPTLHKPSIMGHRVRVLPGEKTIRMHYANCNTYNADFDGDEMNMHFPQSEIARSEALQIADTDHQYLSGTQGKPLRGLIQDHLSVSVSLCNRDTFFDRGSYHQLVYNAIRPESGHIAGERIELLKPAILKPIPRWTGKQVISTILKNIQPVGCGKLNMSGKTQLKPEQWANRSEEANVLFHNGDFISGILDKAHLGPSSGGFIHAVHETYGPSIAGKLLSSIGRLLTRYLNMRAFTCGMDDLKLTPRGEKMRKEQLQAASEIGLKVAANYVTLQDENVKEDDPELLVRLESVMRDDTKQHALDLLMNQGCASLSTSVTKACLPAGLEKQFPKNQMQAMTTSGAKGSGVNANLISCNLGQQVLEGRRVPLMVSGKSLPCFSPFDTNVRAGGYIVNRFLTGIRPQEYYFHHMAGREGLIDTAVKTASSGYLQRCLIKGMEGLKTFYDSTVRDSDGTLIQFLFGEDGVDVTKAKYLNDFGFTLRNIDSELSRLHLGRPNGQVVLTSRDDILKRMKHAIKHANDPNPSDPVMSGLNPARFAYATSEKFYITLSSYLRENKDGLIKPGVLSRKAAETVLTAKYNRSLVEPGEAVGIVAGQSVGEPSTQMTLNTFHLAGHSAKNVTLGIPRLREILMTASDHISTPAMTLFPNEDLSDEECERFAKAISVLPLSYVLDKATVQERVGKGNTIPLAKIFDIRLDFFPSEEYMKTCAIQVSDVLEAVERKFIPMLVRLIEKEIKKQEGKEAVLEIGVKAGAVEVATHNAQARGDDDGDEDDEDDGGDGDTTDTKKRANRSEAVSYGPNDEDDDAIQDQMQRDAFSEPEDEGFGASPQVSSEEEDGRNGKGAMANRIKDANQRVTRYRADEKGGGWVEFTFEFNADIPKILVLNILLDAIRKCVIQQLDGINACTFVPDEKMTDPKTGLEVPTRVIHTNGVNLRVMQNYADYINPHKISTNDIAAVLRVYGVEACRNNIIQELNSVFTGHGITVDNRHLNLIADYMTRNGEFTPFNRIGLKGNVSPFTKMSFETTVAFLKDAVLDGDWDDLRAPSSRLVVGRHTLIGTNSFGIYSSMD